MADHFPTPSQIDKARIPLRQACELALQIEALGSYAPDRIVDLHRKAFLRQLEYAALKLGFELTRPGPRVVSDNSTDQPVTMGR